MTALDFQQGRLEQACACGRWEAAGAVCSGCLHRTGPDDYYRNGDMARRVAVIGAARAAEEARPKRVRKAQTPDKPASGAPSRASPLPADGTLFGLTSPLRASDGASTPVPNPLSGPGLSDAPSEPRLGHTDPLRP